MKPNNLNDLPLPMSGKVFHLTDQEKRWIGILKKPAPLKGTIHIVIPQHYGNTGMWWESRFVTKQELEAYRAQYPSMQIVSEAGKEET